MVASWLSLDHLGDGRLRVAGRLDKAVLMPVDEKGNSEVNNGYADKKPATNIQ